TPRGTGISPSPAARSPPWPRRSSSSRSRWPSPTSTATTSSTSPPPSRAFRRTPPSRSQPALPTSSSAPAPAGCGHPPRSAPAAFVSVYTGNGAGTFTPGTPGTYDTQTNSGGGQYLAVADFDSNGTPDLIVAHASNLVGLLLNTTPPPAQAQAFSFSSIPAS